MMLETGIKVVDLLAPYAKGGKIGLFGGAGVGKTVLITELINNVAKGNPQDSYQDTVDSLSFVESENEPEKETICTMK